MYPLSDDFMIFNEQTNRYVLTEKDVLLNLGTNLSERVKDKNAINALLNLVSQHVYRFIHMHNIQNDFQDYIIAHTETGRIIVKEAMEQQLTYILTVGDLTRSTDEKKRMLWFDDLAKETLMRTIPEIGTTICYTGRFFNGLKG